MKIFRAPGIALLLLALLPLAFPLTARGQGGPPLITDDPETPGNGNWEINIAQLAEFSGSYRKIQRPYFDINYGWGERIQLKYETGWTLYKDGGANTRSGDGNSLLGVKWRFLDEKTDGVSISTYPQYETHFPFSSLDPLLNDPGSTWLLPIEFAKHFGKLALNPETGYVLVTQGESSWVLGLVLDYELPSNWEALTELHDQTYFGGGGSQLIWNIGCRHDFAEELTLLLAFGHTIENFSGQSGFFDSYLGLQLKL